MRENAKEDIFPNNSFLIDLEGFGVMCLFFFFKTGGMSLGKERRKSL